MYQIIFTPRARKDLTKAPLGVQNFIKNTVIAELSADPYKYGIRLHGIFRDYWKYPFTDKGTHYRLVYKIDKNKLLVFLIIIGTRENFYKEL
ncbi:MAG: type II toxin-antitoxin system RelE/ParE family toxin, partial [Patescibacteria group bacterium]